MNLKNMRNETLIDKLGEAQAEHAKTKRQLDAVKAELIARGIDEGQGNLFSFASPVTTSYRLDTAALKETLSEDFLDKHRKQVTSRQWHIHALTLHKQRVAA